jgi:hypothetical protein
LNARPVVLGALVFGLIVGFLVALIIGSGTGAHQPNSLEWTLQILVLVGALCLVVGRMARRS